MSQANGALWPEADGPLMATFDPLQTLGSTVAGRRRSSSVTFQTAIRNYDAQASGNDAAPRRR
jgi:hypothetical protein